MGIVTKLGIIKDFLFWDPKLREVLQDSYPLHTDDENLRHGLRWKKWERMVHKRREKRRKKSEKLIKQGKYGQALKYM